MKRILLVILMLIIIQLSNTSGLKVSDPSTWFNETEYMDKIEWSFLVDFESDFYLPYDNILTLNFILHKLSHIIFYSILTYLFYINFNNQLKYALTSLFLFAFTDEIHQHFVIGRSGRILDIMLDFIAGTVFILLIRNKLKKTNKNDNKLR